MGLKDLKLFPMEQISVTKIQGRTNTRQYRDAESTEDFVEASTSSSDNSWCYERAERCLPSDGAPTRSIFMGEEPLTSRLERMKLERAGTSWRPACVINFNCQHCIIL